MACSRTATDSHAEKTSEKWQSLRAPEAPARPGATSCSGAAAEGRSTAASEQMRVIWSEQLERVT